MTSFRQFAKKLKKPGNIKYNPYTQTIEIDKENNETSGDNPATAEVASGIPEMANKVTKKLKEEVEDTQESDEEMVDKENRGSGPGGNANDQVDIIRSPSRGKQPFYSCVLYNCERLSFPCFRFTRSSENSSRNNWTERNEPMQHE